MPRPVDPIIRGRVNALNEVDFKRVRDATAEVAEKKIGIDAFIEIVREETDKLIRHPGYPTYGLPQSTGLGAVRDLATNVRAIGFCHRDSRDAQHQLIGAAFDYITGGYKLSTLAEDIAHRGYKASSDKDTRAYFGDFGRLARAVLGRDAAIDMLATLLEVEDLKAPSRWNETALIGPIAADHRERRANKIISALSIAFDGVTAPIHVRALHADTWFNRKARHAMNLRRNDSPSKHSILDSLHKGDISVEVDRHHLLDGLDRSGPAHPLDTVPEEEPRHESPEEVLKVVTGLDFRSALAVAAAVAAIGLAGTAPPSSHVSPEANRADPLRTSSVSKGQRIRPPVGLAVEEHLAPFSTTVRQQQGPQRTTLELGLR